MPLYLLNCADASGVTIDNVEGVDGRAVPHCPGGASWVQVEPAELSFDLAAWLAADPANQAEFAGYFGAGFVLVGMAHAVGWGVRALLSLIGH